MRRPLLHPIACALALVGLASAAHAARCSFLRLDGRRLHT